MYSIDLRKAAVNLYNRLKSYRKAAAAMSVSVGALHTWVTKGIISAPRKRRRKTKVTDNLIERITAYVTSHPFCTQKAIIKHISKAISMRTLRKTLDTIGIVRKRASKPMFGTPKQAAIDAFVQRFKATVGSQMWSVDETYFSEKVVPLQWMKLYF